MFRRLIILAAVLTVSMTLNAAQVEDTNVDSVTAYQPGTLNNASHSTYVNSQTVKTVERTTGYFFGSDYIVCPYNSPWKNTQYVALGSAGSISMELTNWIEVDSDASSLELGIYAAGSMSGVSQQGIVSVSENGTDWYSLNNGGLVDLSTPAMAYEVSASQTNATGTYSYGAVTPQALAGLSETKYDRQTLGSYSSYSDSAFDAIVTHAGQTNSAGGNWFDLSGLLDSLGIDQVGYVKIDVPSDFTEDLRLDGIFINENSLGAGTVPEPASVIMLCVSGGALIRKRRNQ